MPDLTQADKFALADMFESRGWALLKIEFEGMLSGAFAKLAKERTNWAEIGRQQGIIEGVERILALEKNIARRAD